MQYSARILRPADRLVVILVGRLSERSLDPHHGSALLVTPGCEQHGGLVGICAAGCLADCVCLFEKRRRARELAGMDLELSSHLESGRKHGECARVTRQLYVTGGKQTPVLVVPQRPGNPARVPELVHLSFSAERLAAESDQRSSQQIRARREAITEQSPPAGQ